MLINFKNRNAGPMADGELTFARRLDVFLKEELQLFLSTHLPLVMAALEDEFASSAPERNKWFDFDMNMSMRMVDIVGCFAIENVESKFVNNFNRRYT